MLNSGSLHLLHEDSHSGPMALVYDIIVWEGLLATRDIAALVISSSWTRDVSGVDLALQLLYKTPLMSAIDSDRGKQASMFCDEEDGGVSVCETLGRSEPLTTRVFNPADLEDPVSVASLKAANERVLNCTGYTADYGVKLGLYAEAAEHGSPEGLLLWSLLKIYGHESASSLCSFKSSALRTSTLPSTVAFHDQRQGFFGLVGSLVLGNTGAIMPLVNLLLSGVGVPPMNETYTLDDIPLHSEVRAYLLSSSSLLNTLRGVIVDGVATCSSALVSSESALCPLDYTVGGVGLRNYSRASPRDVITDLAIGLLYAASLLGVSEAKAALSYRFEVGRGVIRDEETAAWYGLLSAKRASVDYHALGGEPIVEADRLNDDTEDKVHRGNMGSDDALIQMQLIRAREGHVPSLVAMGDLYYYGARGMPRDQARARDFFMQAAERGSSEGQCGAAGMLLKGEGGDRNVSRAVLLYEEAASNGSIRALNGLGYMFFFGKDLDKNEVSAIIRTYGPSWDPITVVLGCMLCTHSQCRYRQKLSSIS
jgi:TPR repeat protein